MKKKSKQFFIQVLIRYFYTIMHKYYLSIHILDTPAIFYKYPLFIVYNLQELDKIFKMQVQTKLLSRLLLLFLFYTISQCQLVQPSKIHIQSRKYSAFSGEQAMMKVTPEPLKFSVPYNQTFARKPDVGLSVYNLQFDYNPEFSIGVLQEDSTTRNFQFSVVGRPSQKNIYNQLFIMYIASDYEQLGIYMPGPQNTTVKLGIPTGDLIRSQELVFNYKSIGTDGTQPIFPSQTDPSNIRVTVYLTGIDAESETIMNGYSRNYASFSLTVDTKTSSFYTIVVKLRSMGDALIRRIEFTVVYFDVVKIAAQYQMNSNTVVAANFGGTVYKSSISIPLESLPQSSDYQNILQYFFGISEIQCLQGDTINLLAVERFNYNNGKLQNLVLTFQTKDNTTIRRGVYNYIQYKPRNCVDCGFLCSLKPGYPIPSNSSLCLPCLYFCSACDNAFSCKQCPKTRKLGNDSLCSCLNSTLYDDQQSLECKNCFDVFYCETCTRVDVCLTCYTQANFVLNNVLRKCQCKAGYYNSTKSVTATQSLFNSKNYICMACAPECIYCRTPTNCEACTVPYFLMSKPVELNRDIQTCAQICQSNEKYNEYTLKCEQYLGDSSLFDSSGRLGFDWTYKNVNNQLIIDLLFSQKQMTYYFYENGKGYQYVKTSIEQNQRKDEGQSSIYYDDGNGYKQGYGNDQRNGFESSVLNTKITQQKGLFDETALNGEYYGLGQSRFYSQKYKQILDKQISQQGSTGTGQLRQKAAYYDQFNIPFGKHKLNSTTIADSATFLDAIRNNLIFTMDNQSLPYTIKAISDNLFEMIIRTEKTFLTTNASIIFKNPALIRSKETALQTPVVTKQIDRLDYYLQNQLSTGASLKDRTTTIVQILWGACKYLLFIGFGWAVMPLMLILQYIFGHNYITSQLPLNLDYFLTAFADFRNPSILFNPQRNQFDSQVVNHEEIYKRVSSYYEFDRGIDFMKNSFQFFFTPLLSFGLQFLFIGLNCLLNVICKRDIPIISKYFLPRLPLHAAAYTLVQALPISFFFFGQLQDQRYHSTKSPNPIYPSFNAGISYASFFASAIIPLGLLTLIYHYFQKLYRSGTFQLNKIQANEDPNNIVAKDPAMMDDPLWGGDPQKPLSYGFGASVFYLPLLAGFVLSFFTKSYPWQLTGLLLGNTALGSFALGSKHFLNKIPKFFFAGISALMVGYELVHAGVGSNRALSTTDQWNTGYVGIGIIYAMLLAGILFSGYLLYRLFSHLYKSIIKPFGCFSKLSAEAVPTMKTMPDEEINLRDQALGRDQRRKTTIAQSKINYLSNERLKPQITDQEINLNNMNPQSFQSDLQYLGTGFDNRSTFKANDNAYIFPPWSSSKLKKSLPLKINSQNQIYTLKNGSRNIIGTVKRLMQQEQLSENSDAAVVQNKDNRSRTNIEMQNLSNRQISNNNLSDAYEMVRNNNASENFISINNKAYSYREDQMGNFYVMNYMGSPEYTMSEYQFVNIFNNNKNTVTYDNAQYFVSTPYEQNGQYTYYLQNVSTLQKKVISRENLLTLLANSSSKASNRKIPSIMEIPSKKSNQMQEYVQYNMNPSQQNIYFTKSTDQYLINGKVYEKQFEDMESMYFRNIQTGDKIKVSKAMTQIKQEGSQVMIGSVKDLVENKLYQNNQVMIGGQSYIYKGMQNGYYVFMNTVNNSTRSFGLQQLAEYFGYKASLQNIKNSTANYSSQQQIFNSSQTRQLKLYKTNKNENVYIFIDPLTQQQYEMPMEMCDLNEKVYLDQNENIWHKGQMVAFESEISSPQKSNIQLQQNITGNNYTVFNNSPQYKVSQQSINSESSSMSLNRNLNPNEYYAIKVISNTYVYSETRLPSDVHIIGTRDGIKGNNVENVMNELKSLYPQCHILIQSANNPSQKLYIN